MLLNINATRAFILCFFTILNQKEFCIATVAMFTCDLYAGVVPQMSPPPHDLGISSRSPARWTGTRLVTTTMVTNNTSFICVVPYLQNVKPNLRGAEINIVTNKNCQAIFRLSSDPSFHIFVFKCPTFLDFYGANFAMTIKTHAYQNSGNIAINIKTLQMLPQMFTQNGIRNAASLMLQMYLFIPTLSFCFPTFILFFLYL